MTAVDTVATRSRPTGVQTARDLTLLLGRVGLAVLQVYSIARQLVRKKEHADLLPHVENMRRTNPFGRRRAPQPEAKPAADPVTPPVKP